MSGYGESAEDSQFTYESLIGEWESDWTSVEGESQRLTLTALQISAFSRHFKDGKSIKVVSHADDIEILDDIIIIKYYGDNQDLVYKLVLSGWHLESSDGRQSAMYGMIFLCRDNTQFNGFPVSFKPAR